MSFHLRQINKLPKPKDFIKKSPKFDIPSPSNRLINCKKTNFVDLIINQDDKIKLKNSIKEYLEENVHIDKLIKYFLDILNNQYQQNRVRSFFSNLFYFEISLIKNQLIESIRKFVRPNDIDRFDIHILKDDLNTLKVSLINLFEIKIKITF